MVAIDVEASEWINLRLVRIALPWNALARPLVRPAVLVGPLILLLPLLIGCVELVLQLFLLLQQLFHHIRQLIDLLVLRFKHHLVVALQGVVVHGRAISLRIDLYLFPFEVIWAILQVVAARFRRKMIRLHQALYALRLVAILLE